MIKYHDNYIDLVIQTRWNLRARDMRVSNATKQANGGHTQAELACGTEGIGYS